MKTLDWCTVGAQSMLPIAARREVKKQNRVTLAGLGSAARADDLLQPRLRFASAT